MKKIPFDNELIGITPIPELISYFTEPNFKVYWSLMDTLVFNTTGQDPLESAKLLTYIKLVTNSGKNMILFNSETYLHILDILLRGDRQALTSDEIYIKLALLSSREIAHLRWDRWADLLYTKPEGNPYPINIYGRRIGTHNPFSNSYIIKHTDLARAKEEYLLYNTRMQKDRKFTKAKELKTRLLSELEYEHPKTMFEVSSEEIELAKEQFFRDAKVTLTLPLVKFLIEKEEEYGAFKKLSKIKQKLFILQKGWENV